MTRKIGLEDLNDQHFKTAQKLINVCLSNLTRKGNQALVSGLLECITKQKTPETLEVEPEVKKAFTEARELLQKKDFEGFLNYGFSLDQDEEQEALPPEGLTLVYCGVFWNYWFLRYLIGESFGCALDTDKLVMLGLFCNVCPITLMDKNGKVYATKPTKVKWRINGTTEAPFHFPVCELDGDGESAVECAGVKLYFYRNLNLPEYIGQTPRAEWRPEWVFKEKNQEVKRALLQEIPSEKLASALDLVSLSKYDSGVSSYELVEARNNPFPSPYRALRFECPTTKRPYLVRVAPETKTAEEGITALNGGIHPSEFQWEM